MFSEGKDRYQDYKTDAADGKVNWMQQGKDALADYKADTQVLCALRYCHVISCNWIITSCSRLFWGR